MWKGQSTKRPGWVVPLVAVYLRVVLSFFVSAGCAERDPVKGEEQSPALQKANAALKNAEEALKAVHAEISFEDIANLDNLRDVLPDPKELTSPESQAYLETAIAGFYEVFDTLNIVLDPLELSPLEAPAVDVQEVVLSVSDRALIHLYLTYAYTFDAIARAQAVGGDLYTIEYNPNAEFGQVYKFTLLKDVRDLTPEEVLALFTNEQKQAVLDVVALLTGGKIHAEGLRPSLDPKVFRRSAVYHLAKVAKLAEEISPNLVRAMNELQETIESKLTGELLAEVESWGFTLEALPPELAKFVR